MGPQTMKSSDFKPVGPMNINVAEILQKILLWAHRDYSEGEAEELPEIRRFSSTFESPHQR